MVLSKVQGILKGLVRSWILRDRWLPEHFSARALLPVGNVGSGAVAVIAPHCL